jgi:hypothetical protein
MTCGKIYCPVSVSSRRPHVSAFPPRTHFYLRIGFYMFAPVKIRLRGRTQAYARTSCVHEYKCVRTDTSASVRTHARIRAYVGCSFLPPCRSLPPSFLPPRSPSSLASAWTQPVYGRSRSDFDITKNILHIWHALLLYAGQQERSIDLV